MKNKIRLWILRKLLKDDLKWLINFYGRELELINPFERKQMFNLSRRGQMVVQTEGAIDILKEILEYEEVYD